jgi:hypothetical protein
MQNAAWSALSGPVIGYPVNDANVLGDICAAADIAVQKRHIRCEYGLPILAFQLGGGIMMFDCRQMSI